MGKKDSIRNFAVQGGASGGDLWAVLRGRPGRCGRGEGLLGGTPAGAGLLQLGFQPPGCLYVFLLWLKANPGTWFGNVIPCFKPCSVPRATADLGWGGEGGVCDLGSADLEGPGEVRVWGAGLGCWV